MTCGLIDLNTVTDEDETVTLSVSSSSSVDSGNLELATTSLSSSVCMELWHACAGPSISLPKKGSAVVYFPQGHVEHLPGHPAVAYNLPPHVFCRVAGVKLHADEASDEVYAQVSLVPDQQIEQKWREGIMADAEDEDPEGVGKSATPHMFCKTLTASDTSTHGGFSVPRRAAEDCFPPLDYNQQRPSQELVAKDLHGIEWKFRHIYRGQPRRHLLTTGWSAFVNKKKLVSGDAVIFLRGADGELRLGIRRAAQVKSGAAILPPSSLQFGASSVAAIANAVSMKSTFNIFYNPRVRSSEIIVPCHKFSKSLSHSFSCGMRFQIRLETEDSSERRCTGVIVGVSDVDPTRWPGSKWKCLLVKWDDMGVNRFNRISPWEIEPAGSVSGPNSFLLPGNKRSRVGFAVAKPDLPVPRDGNEVSDFRGPLRFQKVLQGQEVFGFRTPFARVEAFRQHPSDMRYYVGLNCSKILTRGNSARNVRADARNPLDGTVLSESFQFHKVLQGQETVPIQSYGRRPEANQVRGTIAADVVDGVQVPCHGNCWPTQSHVYSNNTHPTSLVTGSLPLSALLFQQSGAPPSQTASLHCGNQDSLFVSQRTPWKFSSSEGSSTPLHGFRSTGGLEDHSHKTYSHCPIPSKPFIRDDHRFVSTCKDSCRLFGFPLTNEKFTASRGENENPTSSTSAHCPEEESLPCSAELPYQPPLMTKVMVSSCTKVSDMHAVRDTVDITL